MSTKSQWIKSVVAGLAVFGLSDAAHAVIVTGPQGQNVGAPTGSLAGSGYQFQGLYGDYLGTPIAPNWFITANHFGEDDTKIILDGTHNVINSVVIPGTDLVLRQVAEPFSAFASIYNPATDGDLFTTDPIIVFGRGSARGTAVTGQGWNWGAPNSAISWGTNNIDVLYTDGIQTFMGAFFDGGVDDNQATLSVGDSGGAVFVNKNGEWKLVGINSGVELFRETPDGPDLLRAVYDATGLYQQTDVDVWTLVTETTPQYWEASYVPAYLELIGATVPEPASLTMVAAAGLLLGRRRRT